MITSDNILPVTQVKRDLMKLLRSLHAKGGIYTITKDGRAAGILMSPEAYEGLLETIEIIQDRTLLRSLRRAIKQLQEGKTYTEKEVFED